MKKNSKAYKTIGEVAEILELGSSANKKNTHTIRYWGSEFKQIKPIVINKRRYYDDKSIDLLKKIKFLLKDKGMTISGVKKQLNEEQISVNNTVDEDEKQEEINDPDITSKDNKFVYDDMNRYSDGLKTFLKSLILQKITGVSVTKQRR